MNRATTSLPVPDSPVNSTVVSVSATCVAFFSTSIHSGDLPTTRGFDQAEQRTNPRRHNPFAKIRRLDDRQFGGGEIVDDDEPFVGRGVVGLHEAAQSAELVGR